MLRRGPWTALSLFTLVLAGCDAEMPGLGGGQATAPSSSAPAPAASIPRAPTASGRPPASAAAAAAAGPPKAIDAALSAPAFAGAFTHYLRANYRSPGQGGLGSRPSCGNSGSEPVCEHGRVEGGVSLRIRWRPGRPTTLRIHTAPPHPRRLGLACPVFDAAAVEVQRWSAPDGASRVQCEVPMPDGSRWVAIVDESDRGTTLSAFRAEHLAWDTEYRDTTFAGSKQPPPTPPAPAAPTGSSRTGRSGAPPKGSAWAR